MGETMFTEAQLDILRKGFQEHDFTQAVSLHSSCEALPPEQAAVYADLKKQALGYFHFISDAETVQGVLFPE